jgi:Electron transfer flavoprotein domain
MSSNALYLSNTSSLARLLSTLAVLEQRDGKLNGGSLCAVTAAKKLGGSVTGFVAGGNIKGVAEQAAKGNGMEKVVMVDNAAYDKVRRGIRIGSFGSQVLTSCRVYQRISLHCLLRISRKEDTHM